MDLNYFYKYNIQTINSNISLQIADYVMYILLNKFKKHEINTDDIENIYKWLQVDLYIFICKNIKILENKLFEEEFEYDNTILGKNNNKVVNLYKLKFLKKIINIKLNTFEKLNTVINDINILMKPFSKL